MQRILNHFKKPLSVSSFLLVEIGGIYEPPPISATVKSISRGELSPK